MRRFSVYFLFSLSVFLLTGVFAYFSNRALHVSYYNKWLARAVDRLNDEGLVARSFYEVRKDQAELEGFLESRRRSYAFNFWALYRDGQPIKTNISGLELARMKFDLSAPNTRVLAPAGLDYFYAVERLHDDSVLVVGLRQRRNEFMISQIEERWGWYLFVTVGFLLVTFAMFTLFFRDIRKAVRQIASGRQRQSFTGGWTLSREADLLMRGLDSFDRRASELKREKEMFIWQVLPSLRTELMSGRTPPYDFSCTLVRTDVNHFTKIYNEHPVEPFAETINDFFTDVSHVVSRYGGLVHEFIGDEVIFYFKDKDGGNSVLAAIGALDEINKVANRYHVMTTAERGYPFTVKSTLAHGSLRFGKFVNGYNIAGPTLIETVRILSHIHDKEENTVVFASRHLETIGGSVRAQPYGRVQLRGFTSEIELVSYLGKRWSVEECLAQPKFPELLFYCRGDEDLSAMVTWARQASHREGEERRVMEIIGILRQVRVTRANGGQAQRQLLAWAEELLGAIRLASSEPVRELKARQLSALLRLMENLVPAADFGAEFEAVLKAALECVDRRVVANAIDTLAFFQKDYEPGLAERLVRHLDNRIAANALVHDGIKEITPKVVKRLRCMIQSRIVANVASGLYAFGEIAAHHRLQDPVYLSTQLNFLELARFLPKLAAHEDVRVRRQLFMAARKLADQSLIKDIWSSVNSLAGDNRDAIIAEARSVLGEAAPQEETDAGDPAVKAAS